VNADTITAQADYSTAQKCIVARICLADQTVSTRPANVSEDVHKRLQRLAVATKGVGQSDSKPLPMPQRRRPYPEWLANIALRHIGHWLAEQSLPPLAILCIARQESLKTPPPLRVPFEPVRLSDKQDVKNLLEASRPHRDMPVNWWEWVLFAPLGALIVGVALFRPIVVFGLLMVMIPDFPQTGWASAIARPIVVLLLMIVIKLVLMALARWRNSPWWLIPGGIVTRTASPWSTRCTLARYTPADSLLMITEQDSVWRAMLYRDGRLISRESTEEECEALLAVWQSPLRPPAPDEMTDLR